VFAFELLRRYSGMQLRNPDAPVPHPHFERALDYGEQGMHACGSKAIGENLSITKRCASEGRSGAKRVGSGTETHESEPESND